MNAGVLTSNPLATAILGVLAAGLVGATLLGIPLPLVGSDRAVLIVLALLGMALCALGMRLDTYGWTHPANLAGMVLGVLALLVIVLALFGVRLPYLATDRAALVALAGIMVVKMGVALTRGVIR
jgi:hypothetical protein